MLGRRCIPYFFFLLQAAARCPKVMGTMSMVFEVSFLLGNAGKISSTSAGHPANHDKETRQKLTLSFNFELVCVRALSDTARRPTASGSTWYGSPIGFDVG